tara:strand:- start:111 stop:2816 length:2706 start_codon:yes stop_codon:yes gene_type:complete
VGNSIIVNETFSVDYIAPLVEYSVDSSCSWYTGTHYDMQSSCEVNVNITDDSQGKVKSVFTMLIYQDGELAQSSLVNGSTILDLSQYSGSSISVIVQGSDLTGKAMPSNNLDIVTRNEISPIWVGLICSSNTACPWENSILSSSLNDTIGVKTPPQQAPIISVDLEFSNALSNYKFGSNFFVSSSLPDGSYLLTAKLVDEAGREFTLNQIPFVFDNNAPEIEILSTLSNGIISENMILSCDECELVWRVNEISNYTTDTNHGVYSSVLNQYTLQTSTLGQNNIMISAVDSFGRKSYLNISTTPVRTTSIGVVEELYNSNQISLQCLESSSEGDLRNINCLWKRKDSTITTIPIQIELDIDQPWLRDVKLIIYKSGGGIETVNATSGIMTIPFINHYTESFEIELYDEYSEIGNIQFNLFEHTNAWSDLELQNEQISEDSNNSEFDVVVSPPDGELDFYLLKRGLIGLDDLFDCFSTYSFASKDDLSLKQEVENCNLDSKSLIFLSDGKISFTASVDHSEVRDDLSLALQHKSPLFNLEYYSLGITYSDSLGVNSQSNLGDMIINSENIIRTEDNLPMYNSSISSECPLGMTNLELDDSDGFLQSQATSPLSTCSKFISDEDGINRIIWKFTFIDGNERFESEVECSSTYFPVDWNFQDAIDANLCKIPSHKFPSGVFDVIVRPWIVDESIYVRDKDDYLISENGFYSKPIIQGDCSDNVEDCKFVQYELFDVVVSPSLNPISEVENSKALVEAATNFVDSWFFIIILITSSVTIFGVIIKFYRKFKNSNLVTDEETKSESDDELTAEQVRFRYELDDQIFQSIMQKYGISIGDKDDFLLHLTNFDENFDGYLSEDEMILAAEEWVSNRYAKLTVVQLRELLRQRGLPVSGNKSELISRLSD